MLLTKEKLTVEVAEVDSVQINDVNFAEAGKDEILQELTANSASADHQNTRLMVGNISNG